MASTHTRNVRGMHGAPRCEALTKAQHRCRNPAIGGKRRCKEHGGKGSATKSHRQEYSDYSKAYLHWDQLLNAEIKNLDKVIRKIERSGKAPEFLDDLSNLRRGLHHITKQKQEDLAASYAPPESQRLAEREEAARLDTIRKYSATGQDSREMIRARARGAMLGLATGEAVGLTLAGMERGSYRPIGDMRGGGLLDLKPGQWAGDTAMALALMQTLSLRRAFDERDFMDLLLEWRDDGVYSCTGSCVGIGETTREALAKYERTDDPVAGESHADCLSNGSLARLAPVAILYFKQPGLLREVAERQSLTTHGGPGVVQACQGFANILADAITGLPLEAVLTARSVSNSASLRPILVGEWKDKSRDHIRGSDNALTSLEAAMWCVGKTDHFEEAVLFAANLGEDSGSTAALAGQLAGALYGASSIPDRWLERLAWREKIDEMTDVLFDNSRMRAGSPRS